MAGDPKNGAIPDRQPAVPALLVQVCDGVAEVCAVISGLDGIGELMTERKRSQDGLGRIGLPNRVQCIDKLRKLVNEVVALVGEDIDFIMRGVVGGFHFDW